MCMRKTSCSFRRQCAGQATVEAAVLIPSVMLLLGILVQPVCLLYTRAVMHGTAAETARAVLTARGAEDLTECEQYARRRLAAVPEVSVFHVGGTDDWQIGVAQGDDGAGLALLDLRLVVFNLASNDLGYFIRSKFHTIPAFPFFPPARAVSGPAGAKELLLRSLRRRPEKAAASAPSEHRLREGLPQALQAASDGAVAALAADAYISSMR